MKKHAFTMAEILISLTIIGVIAALTLPALTGNISSKQFATTYKKAYATIAQALKMGASEGRDASQGMSILEHILTDNIGAKSISTADKTLWTIEAPAKSTWAIDNDTKAIGNGPNSNAHSIAVNSNYQVFMLKDGMSHLIVKTPTDNKCFGAGKPVYVSNRLVFTGRYCEAFLDVNGAKGPNIVVSCANQAVAGVMPSAFTVDNAQNVGNCKISTSIMTDVFPVIIYDDKIIPATPAAAAVLQDAQD